MSEDANLLNQAIAKQAQTAADHIASVKVEGRILTVVFTDEGAFKNFKDRILLAHDYDRPVMLLDAKNKTVRCQLNNAYSTFAEALNSIDPGRYINMNPRDPAQDGRDAIKGRNPF